MSKVFGMAGSDEDDLLKGEELSDEGLGDCGSSEVGLGTLDDKGGEVEVDAGSGDGGLERSGHR